MKKRIMSIFLAAVLLLALVPAVTPTADAAAAGTVYADVAQKNLDKLINALNGKYFTVNQKACNTPGEGSHGCSNCGMVNVIKEQWLKTAVGRVPSSTSSGFQHYYYDKTLTRGQSCCGFANFAGWYIFSSKSSDTVTFSKYKTGSFNSSTMANAKPGDVLRFGSSTSSNSHSAVFISTYSDGIYVLDSNWSYSGGNCKVTKHKIAYSKYKYVTVSRAKNYEPNKNSTYEAELYNNYSGKNYLPAVGASGLSDTYWSRDTSVATVAADSTVKRVSSCDTLKITNTAAGKSGTDLVFKTNASDTTKNGAYSLGDQSMVLSFWAKADNAGTKMYFRWGYESDYRSITLTTNWKYYTVDMSKTSSYGENIHPYVDRAGTVWLSELQLEEGSSATSYTAETGGMYGKITSSVTGKYSGLTTPSRSGYSFDGWYTKAVGGTQITKDSSVLIGDIKLYAHWTKNHTHSYTATTKEPTCTSQGYTTYICSCGSSYKANYKDALGHNYINGICTRCNGKLSSEFADVKAGAYYFDAVKWAVDKNITNGIGGGLFDPDGSCTRAQIVTFLWRANGSPRVNSLSIFSDVKEGEYYYDAVRWAVANGITNGVGDGLFDPDGECSRSQIVTFLWRAEGSPKVSSTVTFPDVKPGAFYYDAVRWAVANGITNGSDGGKFDTESTCTRAQAVTFLYRAYGK